MRSIAIFSMFTALSFLAAPAVAIDLSKINRSIGKEPVYQSKDPQYCLMVFGPEAKTQVWLVLDGDSLYVDRNGDGDLTEPGERIESSEPLYISSEPADVNDSSERPDPEVVRTFFLHRTNRNGRNEGKSILDCVPDVTFFHVTHSSPADDRKDARANLDRKFSSYVAIGSVAIGENSSLAFAARPGDAPILHFDGPRQLALASYSDPLRRGETTWLAMNVCTPGLNATVRTELPKDMADIHPIAEIECPPRRPGDEPIRMRLELPGRG